MDAEALVSTRRSMHSLAEHLLAGDLWRRTGKIGLRRTPGGFGQPETLVDGTRRRLRIDGTRIAVLDGDIERWEELSTPVAAATFADSRLEAPTDAFTPESVLRPEEPLLIDPAAAATLAQWFDTAERALEEIRRRYSDLGPTFVQLWPEHFDLAFSMSEINFGGSPGDADHDEPYLYVGPWNPLEGPAWNESWGMSASASSVADWSDAVEFFETGLRAALVGPQS